MGDINTKFHPSSDVAIDFNEASDVAVRFSPSADIAINIPHGNINVIVNGTFDTDTDWNKGPGWVITGGKAVATATTANIDQAVLEVGETYKITYTVSDYDSGIVRCRCGVTSGLSRNANGTYEQIILCGGDTKIRIDGVVSFTGKIDNVIAIKQ